MQSQEISTASSDHARSQSLHTRLRFSCSSSDDTRLMCLLRQRKGFWRGRLGYSSQSKPQTAAEDASPNVRMQAAEVELEMAFALRVMRKDQVFIRQGTGWLARPERTCTWRSSAKLCRKAPTIQSQAPRRSCLTTMASTVLAAILIAVVFSNAFLAAASPAMPAKPKLPTGKGCLGAASWCRPAVQPRRMPVSCRGCNCSVGWLERCVHRYN